jgi:DNA polymerase I-like protein with 3'-5' exonuclease and polymerase domains
MKRGMARVWGAIKEWRKDGLDIRPVLQIHDELVCLVPEEWVEFVIPEIVRLMEEDSGMFPVKIGCKGVSGKRWGDLKD